MNPSDEVASHELVMRVRTLHANVECAWARVEMTALEAVPKITALLHELVVLRQRWEIEQRDAWAIAQSDPDAWLDRLVLAQTDQL